MKNILVLFFLFNSICSMGITSNYHENVDSLSLNQFIELLEGSKDVTYQLKKVVIGFRALDKVRQENFKTRVLSSITDKFSLEKKDEAFSLICLYQSIADNDDEQLPILYFLQGNIFAERMDSVSLKETIFSISDISSKRKISMDKYIVPLNNYLEQIRHYVPANKNIEGYWVSDKMVINKGMYAYYNIPKYIIHVSEYADSTNLNLLFYCPFVTSTSKLTVDSFWNIPTDQHSQLARPFSTDSLYVVWSSEKLQNYNAGLVGILRQTVGTTSSVVVGEFSQRNKYGIGQQMTGSMMTGMVEIGLNSLIDHLFEPSKKIYLLEARLQKVSDDELRGKMIYKKTKLKESTTNIKFDEEIESLSLLRWTRESGVIFMTAKSGCPITPYDLSMVSPKKKKKYSKNNSVQTLTGTSVPKSKLVSIGAEMPEIPYWKDVRDDMTTEFGKAYQMYKKSKDKNKFLLDYNAQQMERLRQYTRQKAIKNN